MGTRAIELIHDEARAFAQAMENPDVKDSTRPESGIWFLTVETHDQRQRTESSPLYLATKKQHRELILHERGVALGEAFSNIYGALNSFFGGIQTGFSQPTISASPNMKIVEGTLVGAELARPTSVQTDEPADGMAEKKFGYSDWSKRQLHELAKEYGYGTKYQNTTRVKIMSWLEKKGIV